MLLEYIHRQINWSKKTFGVGKRTHGIIRHIQKELNEISDAPEDLSEWVDVIILAIDGAWRAGHLPVDIVEELWRKQRVNFSRNWPPIQPEDHPTEHVKEA